MHHHETSRIVEHSATEMFDLVADVEKYPEFVPFCERLHVRGRKQIEGRTILVADMTVGYKMLRETFTSKVTLDRQDLSIRADYLDGPFRTMENVWNFEPLGESQSKIHFYIDYEFKSRTLAAVMGAMFDRVFRTFASSFERRADTLYGREGVAPTRA
ncbi:type II toxin-antitoxin system RatA family toxin [Afifella sp. IM 167]|uniref:type II toxin-antitoxin system RatA family toxin n=1 Tax=Afifella sp. IM 167 TaxID=2033586 RepID=UPI001CCEC4E7|nr:type II toxin-antitoxin system RatA family toxin [Afifella sp. IM 167]MBZ8132534.1 ubiquinone-binding protein [Afifella sp. IM 167]